MNTESSTFIEQVKLKESLLSWKMCCLGGQTHPLPNWHISLYHLMRMKISPYLTSSLTPTSQFFLFYSQQLKLVDKKMFDVNSTEWKVLWIARKTRWSVSVLNRPTLLGNLRHRHCNSLVVLLLPGGPDGGAGTTTPPCPSSDLWWMRLWGHHGHRQQRPHLLLLGHCASAPTIAPSHVPPTGLTGRAGLRSQLLLLLRWDLWLLLLLELSGWRRWSHSSSSGSIWWRWLLAVWLLPNDLLYLRFWLRYINRRANRQSSDTHRRTDIWTNRHTDRERWKWRMLVRDTADK